MSEPTAALGGARFDGLVRIEEQAPRGMITLRGDLAASRLQKAATKMAGVDFPAPLQGQCDGDRGLLWMAPDELLIFAPYHDVSNDISSLERALKGTHHLVENVSDARSSFAVQGRDVRDVLAKLCPLDLHADSFVPGTFRRTRIAQVAAAIWMRDDQSSELICFRSVAQYVFDVLCEASRSDARVDYH
jgi:sarcosine oxidase subunit gamma